MVNPTQYSPRVGVVGLAYPGYNLGEELCELKLREMVSSLDASGCEILTASRLVLDEATAACVGKELSASKVDCLLAVITTFVPDHFIVRLLDHCNVPIFLWCVERELKCIALVCGPLITATLFELEKPYALAGADIVDSETRKEFYTFARAAMLLRACRDMRVGYVGGKNEIMFSMSADDYTLKRTLGVTIVDRPTERFYQYAESIRQEEVARCWKTLRTRVGQVCATEPDCLLSTRYYLAAKKLCEELALDALSLNCFPHLKSKICLALACLNDDGISAACEGDLYSTILMHLLHCLTNRAAFNGDFLRMDPKKKRSTLFSLRGGSVLSRCVQGGYSSSGLSGDTRRPGCLLSDKSRWRRNSAQSDGCRADIPADRYERTKCPYGRRIRGNPPAGAFCHTRKNAAPSSRKGRCRTSLEWRLWRHRT